MFENFKPRINLRFVAAAVAFVEVFTAFRTQSLAIVLTEILLRIVENYVRDDYLVKLEGEIGGFNIVVVSLVNKLLHQRVRKADLRYVLHGSSAAVARTAKAVFAAEIQCDKTRAVLCLGCDLNGSSEWKNPVYIEFCNIKLIGTFLCFAVVHKDGFQFKKH